MQKIFVEKMENAKQDTIEFINFDLRPFSQELDKSLSKYYNLKNLILIRCNLDGINIFVTRPLT